MTEIQPKNQETMKRNSDIPTVRQSVLMLLACVAVLVLASECDDMDIFALKSVAGLALLGGTYKLSRIWK